MWEYRASPEELPKEETREEEIQTVTDLPEGDIHKRERADNIHGDHERFIEHSQPAAVMKSVVNQTAK